MPGNPADIGGTEVDVVVVKVEDQLAGVGCVGQIAAGGVHHAGWVTNILVVYPLCSDNIQG